MVPKLRIFNLLETLHFHKFEDAEFKCKNIFSNLSPKYPNEAVLVPNLIFFPCFANFFAFRQILGGWFQISQSFFPIFSLKIPKRTVLVLNLTIFIFARNSQPKITQIRHFSFQNWNSLCHTTYLLLSVRVLIPTIYILRF